MASPMTSLLLLAILATAAAACAGAEIPPLPLPVAGWVDRDDDGRHDTFCDANGDGVNDLDARPYAHGFGWLDQDGDGLNDWFRDADGDGVNDLETTFRDRNHDGQDDNVLDADRDGRNDVTGLAYARDNLHGEAFGRIDDGQLAAEWIDEDGDGFADEPGRLRHRHGREDRFVDRDGDGMADGRWLQDGGFRHQHGSSQGGQGGQGGQADRVAKAARAAAGTEAGARGDP